MLTPWQLRSVIRSDGVTGLLSRGLTTRISGEDESYRYCKSLTVQAPT